MDKKQMDGYSSFRAKRYCFHCCSVISSEEISKKMLGRAVHFCSQKCVEKVFKAKAISKDAIQEDQRAES